MFDCAKDVLSYHDDEVTEVVVRRLVLVGVPHDSSFLCGGSGLLSLA